MRGRNISGQVHEVLQDSDAAFMTSLGMALDSHDVVLADDRRKVVSVRGRSNDELVIDLPDMIGVNEIETVVAGDTGEKRMVARSDRVPSHVWDFESTFLLAKIESSCLRFDPSKTFYSSFVAPPGEKLHPEADSEDGDFIIQYLFFEGRDEIIIF